MFENRDYFILLEISHINPFDDQEHVQSSINCTVAKSWDGSLKFHSIPPGNVGNIHKKTGPK